MCMDPGWSLIVAGTVNKAVVTGNIREFSGKTVVAIKQSKAEIALSDIKDFFLEADIMKKFSNPHHRNVWWTHLIAVI